MLRGIYNLPTKIGRDMPHRRHRFLSGIFLVIGAVMCASSIVLGADFMRAAQAIVMMGSQLKPDGVMVESIFIVIFFLLLFSIGAGLVVVSARNLIKSFKK
jgi:hypothetical protein